jgi:hypothetical protein
VLDVQRDTLTLIRYVQIRITNDELGRREWDGGEGRVDGGEERGRNGHGMG